MNRFNDQQENKSLVSLEKYKPIADDTAGVFSADPRYRKEATRLQECAENVRIYLNPSQARWAQLWKESLQVHYTPEVDVQRLSPEGQSADEEVLRRLSYSTKPRVTIPEPAWFLEMVEQLHHTQRAIVTGQLKHWSERFKAANQYWHLDGLNVDSESDPHKRYRWDPDQGLYVQAPD